MILSIEPRSWFSYPLCAYVSHLSLCLESFSKLARDTSGVLLVSKAHFAAWIRIVFAGIKNPTLCTYDI
jgi:hypothetical protein